MAERTRLVFGGGEGIIVALPLNEIADQIDLAFTEQRLLTIRPSNGDEIVINPMQVKWLQRADD